MPHPYPAPTRSLPARPSLAQLRKQAKELLKSYRAGQAAAVDEVQRFERSPDPAAFALADAQRVLARAYGFASWTRLKQQVEGLNVEALCEAAAGGDVATVRRLATARPELVNFERGGGYGERIALHFAVLNRDAPMTRVLMELGSDARKGIWPHRDATSAYTMARERGYDEIVAIIGRAEDRRRKQLSSPGAAITAKTEAIHRAILEDRCEDAIRILEADLSLIGACSNSGATPLHIAARKHNSEMVAWLLDRQAPPNARDAEGKTPLDYAATAAGWSAHGRDFRGMGNSRVPPERFHEIVRLLRAAGAELTARAAVAIGDREAVQNFHRAGQLDGAIDPWRGGLLSIAVRANRPEMVTLLLDLGFDPDEATIAEECGQPSWGMPLWFSALYGRHEIAELLLSRGADVNAIVYASGDAMCNADRTQDELMKKLLLDHGARITVERVAGERDRKAARAILDGTMPAHSLNVAEPSHTDLAEQMLWSAVDSAPEIVRMCLPYMTRGGDDPWWNYVLLNVTQSESLRLLLDHGIDPDVVGNGGYTMLHNLATQRVAEQIRVPFATMLLDAGASLDKRDSLLKSTPLGWACRWGRRDLVNLYLERGADAREADAEPWATPLAWAAKSHHAEIVDLLRSRGAT